MLDVDLLARQMNTSYNYGVAAMRTAEKTPDELLAGLSSPKRFKL